MTQVTPILSFSDFSVFDFASLILLRNTSNQCFPINNLFLMAVCIILPMQNTHSESLLQCKVVGGFLVQICAFIFGYLYLFYVFISCSAILVMCSKGFSPLAGCRLELSSRCLECCVRWDLLQFGPLAGEDVMRTVRPSTAACHSR